MALDQLPPSARAFRGRIYCNLGIALQQQGLTQVQAAAAHPVPEANRASIPRVQWAVCKARSASSMTHRVLSTCFAITSCCIKALVYALSNYKGCRMQQRPLKAPWTRLWSPELHSIWQCARQLLRTTRVQPPVSPASSRCISQSCHCAHSRQHRFGKGLSSFVVSRRGALHCHRLQLHWQHRHDAAGTESPAACMLKITCCPNLQACAHVPGTASKAHSRQISDPDFSVLDTAGASAPGLQKEQHTVQQ